MYEFMNLLTAHRVVTMFLASTNNCTQLIDVVTITVFTGIIEVLHPEATEH